MPVMPLIALALMAVGMALCVRALKYRTEDCPPLLGLNPRHWKLIWKTQSWFSGHGFALYLTGNLLILFGLLGAIVFNF